MNIILHLGSNQGDSLMYLSRAVCEIEQHIGKVKKCSSIYKTEAWGETEQADFLNQSIIVETKLKAEEVLQNIWKIEEHLGRKRVKKWGPRTIDIDLLFFGNEIIDTPNLSIPHPQIQFRNFVLIPTMEIAGNFVHPVLNLTIEELYLQSRDTGEVYLLEEFENA